MDDNEVEVAFYIGGRVIRTLFYKTKNPFYSGLRNDTSAGERWYLNDVGQFLIQNVELKVKQQLLDDTSGTCLNDLQISLEAFEEMDKDVLENEMEKIDCNNNDYVKQVKLIYEKYIRIRCHAYAKRATQLYMQQMHKKRSRTGKGERTSFRDNSFF